MAETKLQRHAPLLLCLAAVLLGLLVYLNALGNPFVFDDNYHLVDKPILRDLGNLPGILVKDRFRPVINVMYAVEYALWGLEPVGFHVVSLLLHLANVALLFLLTRLLLADLRRRLGRDDEDDPDPARWDLTVAFGVAALMAAHPMMTEAAGYVSSRAEVLGATFFLLGFLAMRRGLTERRWGWIAAGLVPLALGLGTKEHVAMLPFVVLAYDRLLLDRDTDDAKKRLRWVHLPLTGLVLLAGVARVVALVWVEYPDLPRPIWQNVMMQLSIVWRYIFLLVLPINQSVVHEVQPITTGFDPVAIGAGVALAALLVLAFLGRHRLPLVVFGVAWFFLLLAPSSSVVPLLEPMAEHRVYLASCGFFLAAGAGLSLLLAWAEERTRPPRLFVWGALCLLLAPLAAATVMRNRIWADPITLWSDAVKKAPGVCAPRYALGDALRKRGNCAEAVKVYRQALSIQSDVIDVYINLGICLAKLKKPAEARRVFQNVLKLQPDNSQALNNLARLAITSKKDGGQGREYVIKVLRREPCNDRATRYLVQLDEKLTTPTGKQQARLDFNWLIKACSSNVRALNYLGLIYLREALELRPRDGKPLTPARAKQIVVLFDLANEHFEKVEHHDRNNLFALIRRARLNEVHYRNPSEALRLYRRIRKVRAANGAPEDKGLDQAIKKLEKQLKVGLSK